ncbi:MAG: auxin-responsive protein [Planctomycetota bacterium]|nr:MAG: auxin-responsive protein [Planctomycetota bacterium]
MPSVVEQLAARIALWHAGSVYRRFRADLKRFCDAQERTWLRVRKSVADGGYARRYGLHHAGCVRDLRKAAPIVTYEDLRPTIDEVAAGNVGALFDRRCRIRMFATSSGTTARRKLIPVTDEFVRQYRRGWNTFGVKMMRDHPDALLRAILQSSGRHDEFAAPSGVPCGAITGLIAQSQKRVVRRFYVAPLEIARIPDPQARYYALMRFAATRDVAFAVTANPATLIRLAEVANEQSERLIRDVRDGTVSADLVDDPALRRRLETRLKRAPQRAAELVEHRKACGALRPREMWRLSFLACWTGGSLGHYLPRLATWYGEVPVRDIGLLASEGRVSIPLEDGTPLGVLDPHSAVFEFIPADRWNDEQPPALTAAELEAGRDYVVVLTNDAGLIRYRLDDVVRVHGFLDRAPLIEFLHRAGRVASVAGEKLTEHQVVEAVRKAFAKLGREPVDFVLSPAWGDPPYYRVNVAGRVPAAFAERVDSELCEVNEEYASRRKSLRLGLLEVRLLPGRALRDLDERLISKRGSTAEQYKRPHLLLDFDEDTRLLSGDDEIPSNSHATAER